MKFLISTGKNIYDYVSGDKCLLIKFDEYVITVPYSEETTFKGLIYFALREVFPYKIFSVETEHTDFEEGCCVEISVYEFKSKLISKQNFYINLDLYVDETNYNLYKDGEFVSINFQAYSDKYVIYNSILYTHDLNIVKIFNLKNISKFHIRGEFVILTKKFKMYLYDISLNQIILILDEVNFEEMINDKLISQEKNKKFSVRDIRTNKVFFLPETELFIKNVSDSFVMGYNNIYDINTGEIICKNENNIIINDKIYAITEEGISTYKHKHIIDIVETKKNILVYIRADTCIILDKNFENPIEFSRGVENNKNFLVFYWNNENSLIFPDL